MEEMVCRYLDEFFCLYKILFPIMLVFLIYCAFNMYDVERIPLEEWLHFQANFVP